MMRRVKTVEIDARDGVRFVDVDGEELAVRLLEALTGRPLPAEVDRLKFLETARQRDPVLDASLRRMANAAMGYMAECCERAGTQQ